MRIAIDARELAGRPTGVGRYLAEILAAWAELPAARAHEFTLCSPQPLSLPRIESLRATVIVGSGGGGGTVWEQLVLPRLVRRSGADVLFAPGYSSPILSPVPVVLTVHDVSFAAHPEWFSWREGTRRRVLSGWSARRAARVLTVSDFSKREIVKHFGVDQGRVDVIYSGATPIARPRSRERLVLTVGSIFNRRHVPELIAGFARVAAGQPDLRLEIVGDNRTHPFVDVEGVIAQSGAAGQIRARSYIPDDELADLYGRASVFAFLSSYEGFGLTPLDALAAGIPIVVLDTAVAREIYGPAAIYVERPAPPLVADAIARALLDDQERARMLDAARHVLARYSWAECARRTLQVILASGASASSA